MDGKSTVTTSGKTIKEKQKDLESAKGRIEKVSNAIADITKDADQSLQSVLNEYSEFLKGASVEI